MNIPSPALHLGPTRFGFRSRHSLDSPDWRRCGRDGCRSPSSDRHSQSGGVSVGAAVDIAGIGRGLARTLMDSALLFIRGSTGPAVAFAADSPDQSANEDTDARGLFTKMTRLCRGTASLHFIPAAEDVNHDRPGPVPNWKATKK